MNGETRRASLGIVVLPALALVIWLVLLTRELLLDIPVLVGPKGGAVESSDRLVLDWNDLHRDGVVVYEVEVDSVGPSFEHVFVQRTGLTEPEVRDDQDLHAGEYYWRVRAVVNGTPRRWSAAERFVVE